MNIKIEFLFCFYGNIRSSRKQQICQYKNCTKGSQTIGGVILRNNFKCKTAELKHIHRDDVTKNIDLYDVIIFSSSILVW